MDAKELLRLDLHAKLLFRVGWAWGGEEGWWRGMLGGGIWNWGEVLQKEGVTRGKEVHLQKLQGSISQNMPPQLLAQRGHQSLDQDGCSGCSATPAATSTGCNP